MLQGITLVYCQFVRRVLTAFRLYRVDTDSNLCIFVFRGPALIGYSLHALSYSSASSWISFSGMGAVVISFLCQIVVCLMIFVNYIVRQMMAPISYVCDNGRCMMKLLGSSL